MHTPSINSSHSPFHRMHQLPSHHGHHSVHRHHHNHEKDKSIPEHSSSEERFVRVVDRQVLDKLNQKIGIEGLQVEQLNAEDFTPDKVADRILGAVGQAFAKLKNSESNVDEAEFFAQVRSGIEEGFSEAKDTLESLGILNDEIESNINQTYDLIQNGLNKLEQDNDPAETTETLPSAVGGSTMALQSQSASVNQATEIEIMTQEGDVIKIQMGQSYSSNQTAFSMVQNDFSFDGFESSFSSSSSFNITIEGDLNEEERASLENLVKQMDEVSNSFFNGDVQSAFQQASKMDIDTSQIAGVSMTLEMTRSVQAISAYQQTMTPEESGTENLIKQISDFFDQAASMLDSARNTLAIFDDPMSAFQDLFAGVGEQNQLNAETNPDNVTNDQMIEQLVKPLGQMVMAEE